jgi:hypothetical protein
MPICSVHSEPGADSFILQTRKLNHKYFKNWKKYPEIDLNYRPTNFQFDALPAELSGYFFLNQLLTIIIKIRE